MKRAIILALTTCFFALTAATQTASDYIIIGDVRVGLPGPDIIDSSYTRNPASCAFNIHSSLAVSGIMYPSHLEGAPSPVGMFTALCLPNFSLMNTSVSFGFRGSDDFPVTKNLLGLQFGLSTLDLGIKSPATIALGLAGYMDSEKRDRVESRAFVSDLGCILSIESLVIEALLQNIYCYSMDGVSSFAGPTAEYKLRMRTKLILDIFFAAGLSTTNNIPDADFITEFQMYRFFFSRSLRTGIELNVQNDVVEAGLVIPGQSYGLTIAYFLPERSRPAEAIRKDIWGRLKTGMTGFALNARAMVMITNNEDRSTASPVLSLGVSRFF